MSVPLFIDQFRRRSAAAAAACGSPSRAPVYVVAMHGFLAHSGALQTFFRALSTQIDEAVSQSPCPADIRIICPDARNHGNSQHTPTHHQSELIQDLHAVLHTPPDRGYGLQALDHPGATALDSVADAEPVRVIAVGHSMGSGTWTRYLMEHAATECQPAARGAAACRAVEVVGLVALDMPPITASQWGGELHDELSNVVSAMEGVTLGNIVDYRSAHDELLRCGITDVRMRGMCSTNLVLPPPRGSAAARAPGAVTQTRWKCNLPVLKTALAERALFFSDTYFTERVQKGESVTVPVPVLSLLGGSSPVGADLCLRGLWAKHAVEAEEHVIEGATHTVYFDRPKETAQLTVEFLRRLGVL